jgi:hypothetical protein
MAQNSSSVASRDIHKRHNWQNSYEDILLFSEKPTSYLIVALGHKKINTRMAALQTHISYCKKLPLYSKGEKGRF